MYVIARMAILIAAMTTVHAGAQVSVEVVQLDGTVNSGELVRAYPSLTLAIEQHEIAVSWSDVLEVRFMAAAEVTSATAGALRFELVDGSVFVGDVVDSTDASVNIVLSNGRTVRIDIAAVRSIERLGASEATRRKLAEQRKAAAVNVGDAERDARDLAVVAKGAEVLELRGAVKRIESARVLFSWNNKDVALPWERIGGVLFPKNSPRAASQLVRLVSGDTYAGRVIGGDSASLTLQSSILDGMTIALAEIQAIEVRSEKLVVLSDLPPKRYEFQPFFDKSWTWGRDALPGGAALRLGGKTWRKGIAMRSQSRLSWAIGGGYQRFVAVAGIVDDMRNRGCVTMRVLGDGRELWSAAQVRGGQPPRDVNVSVAGVGELVLVVEFDDDLDIGDQACWAFARLVR